MSASVLTCQVMVRMTREMKEAVQARAAAEDRSFAYIVRRCVVRYIEAQRKDSGEKVTQPDS